MLVTIVSEKRIVVKQPPPQPATQPATHPTVQPSPKPPPTPGRFRNMLARAGTLNGRAAPDPGSAPVSNIEKALPPSFSSPSPAPSPSPRPDSRTSTPQLLVGTPQIDPMADNAPANPAVSSSRAITDTPLVDEPVEFTGAPASSGNDGGAADVPPPTPAKAEAPSAFKEDAPQHNGTAVILNGELNLPPPPSEIDDAS